MKILVWGINYAPEVIGIAPFNTILCQQLRAGGHDVEMATAFPYYPAWRKLAEDSGRLCRTDLIDGIPVHRSWHYVPHSVQVWKRVLHEASFVFTSLLGILIRPRPELIIAISPPLLLGAAARFVSALLGCRYIFHVKDLQPDAALGLGMLRPSLFTRALYALESFSYGGAWRVGGISRGMMAAFIAKGVPPEKCLFFPDSVALTPFPPRGRFRERHGFSPDVFLAVYSGNLGMKQGLDIILDGAPLLTNPNIRLIICGDGAQRAGIAARAAGIPQICFLPLLPDEEYREMLSDADAALITQVAGSGHAFFPSKLLLVLAASLPVITVADEDSELASAVSASGCGENTRPGAPAEFAAAIERLAADPNRRATCAQAGHEWVRRFEREAVHKAFMTEIVKAAS
jgi:colanic acid biosynthesis glycosyl transferase WcaI